MRRLTILLLTAAACSGGAVDGATTVPAPTNAPTTTGPTTASVQSWEPSDPFVGFSLSPSSYDEAGFNRFFERAPDSGSLVAWVGAWTDLEEGGALVTMLSEKHDYVPVIVTGFPTEEGLRVLPEDGDDVVDAVAAFVSENPVPFLGFGVEVNSFLWEKAPGEFERYVEIFDEVATAVHEVSPETKVFPGFQLERLKGLKDGLFGEERTAAAWELVERFPMADAIGFTTYPGLVFAHPDDMPAGYYDEILEHTDKAIVFTEVGWQAGGDLAEWSGTPEKQASFVDDQVPKLARLAEMVIWSFLWDQPSAPPAFATMGLVSSDGDERPAYSVWMNHFGR